MFTRIISIAFIGLSLTACDMGPTSSVGFALPDGVETKGQEIFVRMGCQSCHSVDGMDDLRADIEPEMTIEIGGKTTHIATYGELVTSIINPSHKLAKGFPIDEISTSGTSKMRNYNDVMTVSELIDLVAFLQAQYELQLPPKTAYYP